MSSQPETMLVPQETLDAAIAIVEDVLREAHVKADVETRYWEWYDSEDDPPVMWITAWVREQRPYELLDELTGRIGERLHSMGLSEPQVPIAAGLRPGW